MLHKCRTGRRGKYFPAGSVFIYFDGVGKGVWIDLRDELEIENFLDQIPTRRVVVKDVTKGFTFKTKLDLTDNELEVVLCGGQLRYLKKELAKNRAGISLLR